MCINPNDGLATKAAKYLLCGVDKIISATTSIPIAGPAIKEAWDAMMAMITYSGGFFSWLFGNGSILFPVGMTLGAYTFLTDIVAKSAELFVAVTVTTVLEIMITVTMYRNIALLIGGEAELPGLSKLV